MDLLSFLVGVIVGAPAGGLAVVWLARRRLRHAARLIERARAKQHLQELGRLTGGLAHEIKNPLSAIKLNLNLLAEEFSRADDDVHRRNARRLRRLQDQVQQLHDILDEFLKYAGGGQFAPADIDLRQTVDELIDFFRPQAENARVVLRGAVPPDPVAVRADVGLLKQAILNLMINATQAMTDGGELILRLGAADGQAVLEVIDTGPGIRPEARGRIFDAYHSTRPGGSGLGLPTTRRILRRHGGDVRVDGEPGQGTRFLVTMPLAEES